MTSRIVETSPEIHEAYISQKSLDPFEDEYLIHFLKFKKFNPGISVKQIKRVEKLAKNYRWEITNSGEEQLWFINNQKAVLVPKIPDRHEITLRAHLLGHFQVESTLKQLQEEFYWKNMKETVEQVVASCVECMRHHQSREKTHEPKVLEISGMFNRVGIDLQFGFPTTTEGHSGLLVIVEYLTKYVVAYPIKSKSAIEIAQYLFQYIAMFGPPKEIFSDQGTEFNNQLVDSLIKGAGSEHRVTSAYHPRTNGMTERMNATIANAIRKHAAADQKEWHKWVPFVLLAYRSRIHSSTGYTPFELMFGRKINTFKDWRADNDDNEALWKRSNEIGTLVECVRPKAIENIRENQEKQKKAQSSNSYVEKDKLPVGSRVYVKVMCNGHYIISYVKHIV